MTSTTIPSFSLKIGHHDAKLKSFEGHDQLNRLYEFVIVIEPIPEFKRILNILGEKAVFTIHEYQVDIHEGEVSIDGYISNIKTKGKNWIITLRPPIHRSTKSKRSEIYFSRDNQGNGNLTINEILEHELINDLGLSASSITGHNNRPVNIVLGENGDSLKQSIFCQYNESDFNFIARLCDHWGVQFYFDHFEQQLVFANDKQYDTVIDKQFCITENGSSNNSLELTQWELNGSPNNNFIEVSGFSSNNASNIFIGKYSINTNIEKQTKISLSYPDIENSETAEYLAQIRYEQLDSQLIEASCITSSPYLHPGFTIKTNDDGDFSTSLIESVFHEGTNLERIENNKYSGIYQARIILKPGEKIFRPQFHYPIPIAASTSAKIISELEDKTKVQRNERGEYRVKFINFDNNSFSLPWLRKSQATAGGNSHDLPLLPGTEVRISFLENNPNCPVIEYAIENSESEYPVTSKNPDHAVISTNGMLVTESHNGRVDYSTTLQYQTLNKKDNFNNTEASKLFNILNAPEDIIDYESFRTSGKFIFSQSYGDNLSVIKGNSYNIKEGNFFNGGNAKIFNTTPSYTEHLDHESYKSGNNYSFDFFKNREDLKFNRDDLDEAFNKLEQNDDNNTNAPYDVPSLDINEDSNSIDINKNFRDSYQYRSGNLVQVLNNTNEVTIKADTSSTEIEIDGTGKVSSWTDGSVTEKYYKGYRTHRSSEEESGSEKDYCKREVEENWCSGKGQRPLNWTKKTTTDTSIVEEEKTYNIDNGDLATHTILQSDGMGTNEMNFSYSETNSSNFEFGGSRSFSLSAQGTAALAISLSGDISINIGAGLGIEIETGAASKIEIDLRLGSTMSISDKGRLEWETHGLTAALDSRARVRQENLNLAKEGLGIHEVNLDISKKDISLKNGAIAINSEALTIQGL